MSTLLVANKVCSGCKRELPATSEYFCVQNAIKSGLHSRCRNCTRKYNRGYGKIYRQTKAGKEANRRGFKNYKDTIKGHLRNTFANIKYRCVNPNHPAYHRYGGRGVKCLFTSDEFIDYVICVLQVDPRGLDCDRINGDGDYEPGNIQFITHKENCQKK